MATAADLHELEARCPWDRADFRADLAELRESSTRAARQYADDARVLARLAAQVPRCPNDQQGATPWTSFRREVAVARRIGDRAAATLIRTAVALTGHLPRTLALLDDGTTTVERATTFARELEPYDPELARRVDATLAERAATLPAWRITQDVRRAVQVLDPDAGAHRVSVKNASRGVLLTPDVDDQASLTLFGPAVPLTRWHSTLDQRARALKQAGDPRPLDALRFDLATSTFGCSTHVPADTSSDLLAGTTSTPTVIPIWAGAAPDDHVTTAPVHVAVADHDAAAALGPDGLPLSAAAVIGAALTRAYGHDAAPGLRPSFVEAATDCRASRPVQALITVPVETALGLSNEPGWLDGYGWLSAPTSRQLLVDAELRRACAHTTTGQLLDLDDRALRPPPTPDGVRTGLLDLVLEPATLTGAADRTEPQHDPSEPLRRFVTARDRTDDGPTGSQISAHRSHLDHDQPHPAGPTAAWNLAARSTRTHALKHYGWIPLRTAGKTIWTSPAGQVVEVLHHTNPPPGTDNAQNLPDPHELDLIDRAQLEAPTDDGPPWLPTSERDTTQSTWIGDDDIAC